MDYEDYLGLAGAPNKTGFSSEILFAPKSWFLSLKEPATPFTNPGDSVTIGTTHTFNTGKGFVKLVTTQDTQDLTGETIGDNVDSQGQKIDLTGFLAGLNAVTTELAEALANEEIITLVKDCNLASGTYIQLGCNCDGLRAKISPVGGKKSGGAKGYNITFTGYCGIRYYTGTVTLKP
jgi:hypothetical protein